VIDLDAAPERYADMRGYVEARLLAMNAPSEQVVRLAQKIAEAAGNSFLVASIAARSAASMHISDKNRSLRLPTQVGAALATYIERLPAPVQGRDVLRPLAWAQGAGLPWAPLWPRLATLLAHIAVPEMPAAYDDADVRMVLDSAGDLIVESLQGGQPVYRLFHEALADHLRGDTTEAAAHNALATAMLEQVGDRPWREVQRYVRTYLPAHLLGSDRIDELIRLLTDCTWDRARREGTGDPLAAVGDAEVAIEHLLTTRPTDLRVVPLCVAYSRVTAVPPLIIDVIARSGQLPRAKGMANNLAYANDRMLAFRLLAAVYAEEHDFASAHMCVDEVVRSLASVHPVHLPMAWQMVVEAALSARLAERARESAQAALDAALEVGGDGWDLPNGLFWAAKACRAAEHKKGVARVRAAIGKIERSGTLTFRNQTLQAASVSGHQTLLNKHLAELRNGQRYPLWPVRDGNLALALVDAGMQGEAAEFFSLVGNKPPQGNSDSNKRWAWALALSGRMEAAVTALKYIDDRIEVGKAIARIADLANKRGDQATLAQLVPRAEALLTGEEPRAQARLIRVLWLAGRHEDALVRSEAEIATSHVRKVFSDPRDGESTDDPPKTGKREMVTSVVGAPDEQRASEVETAAADGDLETARRLLAEISIPLFRARALIAIARHDPDPDQALTSWLRALASARPAGRGAVNEVLQVGPVVLGRCGRQNDVLTLKHDLAELDARWELEGFAEQYAALRSTLSPGIDHTRRMAALLLVPRRLADTRKWTLDELHAAWNSGDDGKRLFVLALIQEKPVLAAVDILVDGIRASRSAFEQYNALSAALGAKLKRREAALVRRAVESEVKGEPREDGVVVNLRNDSMRMAVARKLLRRL